MLETYEENPCTNIEQDEYLTFDKKCDTYEDELSEYSDFDSEYEDETLDAVDKGDDEISEDYKQRAVQYWNSMSSARGNKKKRSFSSVQTKFKRLRSEDQLHR